MGFTSRHSHLSRLGALTALVSPLPITRTGGIVSVALSLGSPRVTVNDHPYSSCSDFPLCLLPNALEKYPEASRAITHLLALIFYQIICFCPYADRDMH